MGVAAWLKSKLVGDGTPKPESNWGVGSPAQRFAVIDVETTALTPRYGRVIEIAVVTLTPDGVVRDEFVTRINPQGPVGATHIHGITERDVASAPTFAMVLPEIQRRLAGAAVVAHNAPFDLAFLRAEYERAGWSLPAVPTLCTLEASNYYLPGLSRRKLGDCCQSAGVRLTGAHSALGDARATAALLARFLDRRTSPSPRARDTALLEDAAMLSWPTCASGPALPPDSVVRTQQAVRRVTAPKVPAKALVEMVSRFSLIQASVEGASEHMLSYLEKLAEVLEDGEISSEESEVLADLAVSYGFSHDDIATANRSFILALAHEALQDGKVATAERAELKQLAALLDVDGRVVTQLLKVAERERVQRIGEGLAPLPAGWAHGEPLRVGDRIVITGCEEHGRSHMEEISEKYGVRVMGGVNSKTTLLVSDSTVSGNKAADAEALGVRVVTPQTYKVLLQHLQPAL